MIFTKQGYVHQTRSGQSKTMSLENTIIQTTHEIL